MPALAYPATVLTNSRPEAVAVNTSKSRVPDATAIFSPVREPVLIVPALNTPVKAGLRLTDAPVTGVNVLLGVSD